MQESLTQEGDVMVELEKMSFAHVADVASKRRSCGAT
jgi:hypothetical protein